MHIILLCIVSFVYIILLILFMYVISLKRISQKRIHIQTLATLAIYLFATGAIRYIKNPKIGNKYYLYLQLKHAQMKCREQKKIEEGRDLI